MITLGRALKYFGQLGRNRIPGQVVIQMTSRCNARCPQCGMRRCANIERSSLSDTDIQQILKGCAVKGIQAISFTGGEPLLMLDELIDWIDAASHLGIPFIRTGTNGFLFCGSQHIGFKDEIKRLADRLAATSLRNFWISLDSHLPEIHEKMRGLPGVVTGIERALPIFHAAGIYPSANLGINRYVGGDATGALQPAQFPDKDIYLTHFYQQYRDALNHFYRFVHNLGFSIVNTCYPMSISTKEKQSGLEAVYAASSAEDVVRFAPDEKAMLYKALLNTIPRHRSRLRIFSPLSSVYMLYRNYEDPNRASTAFGCRGGVDFFFIDCSKGDTFPCGYRGNENMGKFRELDLNKLRPNRACHRCDWECFRDPSEMCAPLLKLFHSPLKLMSTMIADPVYRRLWQEDIRYYYLCDLFDGRRPGNPSRFAHYDRLAFKTINALTTV